MIGRALLLCALLAPSLASAAYCPCYTLSSAYNTYNCGVEAIAGTNPTVAQWQPIFDLVCLGPKAWGNQGPPAAAVGQIGQGCGKPMPLQMVEPTFPVELLKGIAMQETGWRQFCNPTTPQDQGPNPERTIIAFDCGYGIGQVTSGMHKGEAPSFDRARVAGDPTYNLSTGTLILAEKWRATNCVGDNQPRLIEDWYTATWAYNGLAYVNNPNNANYSGTRGVWNPQAGGAAPYQEKVFGWIEHPPSVSYWQPVKLAYPDRAAIGGNGAPPNLPEPSCASPTDCANQRSVHATACAPMAPGADLGAAPIDMLSSRPDQSALGDAAGRASDLAASRDGSDGGVGGVTGGCGCAIAGRAPSAGPLLAIAVGLLLALRRRRR